MSVLYEDDKGNAITTHSMIKTMSRCPNQARYKYAERLKTRFVRESDKPLKRGTWFHKLLEEYYAGRDWMAAHQELCRQFGKLFDEERDALGDLPREMLALMDSYLWHYGANKADPYHGWTVHETEMTLECKWPDGNGIYRCRVDGLVEDQYGLWIIDHKTHVKMPDLTFRLKDPASALYIWCAHQNKIPVAGFIWNYVKAKAPTKPALVDQKRTPRLSKVTVDTDYPTMYRAIKEYGLDWHDYKQPLRNLKSQRWVDGNVQSSPFFRRDTLVKDQAMINRVVRASMKTRDRMHGYDWDDVDAVERTVDRSCSWCTFDILCSTELFGGNTSIIRRQQFKVGDPLDYYQDAKDQAES
jgi:hypothetical protein